MTNYCRTAAISVCEAPATEVSRCQFFEQTYQNHCKHLRWGWVCSCLSAQQHCRQEEANNEDYDPVSDNCPAYSYG